MCLIDFLEYNDMQETVDPFQNPEFPISNFSLEFCFPLLQDFTAINDVFMAKTISILICTSYLSS